MVKRTEEPILEEDPKRLIEQVVAMGEEFPGPAEDLLLSWVLSLAPEIDVPSAAKKLLALYEIERMEIEERTPFGRLRLLLLQTSQAEESTSTARRGRAKAKRNRP